MKPTAKQKKICDLIVEQAKFWQSTNDITSPTHLCDIEESVNNTDELPDYYKEILIKVFTDLYFTVRDL